MKESVDEESFQQTLLDGCEIFSNSGYTKPLMSIKRSDISELSRAISLHYTLLQCFAELEQLKKGLKCLGFLEILQSHPDILAPFFISNDEKLTGACFVFKL